VIRKHVGSPHGSSGRTRRKRVELRLPLRYPLHVRAPNAEAPAGDLGSLLHSLEPAMRAPVSLIRRTVHSSSVVADDQAEAPPQVLNFHFEGNLTSFFR
jgi:hypothetical protein